MLRIAFRRRDGGFTMLELIVSVGLMVMLLSVLAFVFNHSAEAVSQANEAVNTVQKARNFEARLGRDLAAAVRYVAETTGGVPQRGFWIDGSGDWNKSQKDPHSADYNTRIEFVSRTMQDGVLRTWDVMYEFTNDQGKDYGAIRRRKDAPNAEGKYVLWDNKPDGVWEEKDEILAWPVRGVYFEAAGDWRPKDAAGNQNTELPSYVRVQATFLDSWGGESFILPMDFYFPVYQGD